MKKLFYLTIAYMVKGIDKVDKFLMEHGLVSNRSYYRRSLNRARFVHETATKILDETKKGGD